MIIGIQCPDGTCVDTKSCMIHCRLGDRCVPSPVLDVMTRNKVTHPKLFSVTTLISPTRIAYLKRVNEFYITPRNAIKAFYGTAVHQLNAGEPWAGRRVELTLQDEQTIGTMDLIEDDILWDYKVWGSYRVAMALGMVPVKFMNTRTNRLNTRWEPIGKPDIQDEIWQLNRYRMLAQSHNYKVKHMKLFIVVKDAELQTAYSRNITEPFYQVPVPLVEDDDVYAYFETKRNALERAISEGTVPALCTDGERWGNRRCIYCDVASLCDFAIQMNSANAVEVEL